MRMALLLLVTMLLHHTMKKYFLSGQASYYNRGAFPLSYFDNQNILLVEVDKKTI